MVSKENFTRIVGNKFWYNFYLVENIFGWLQSGKNTMQIGFGKKDKIVRL